MDMEKKSSSTSPVLSIFLLASNRKDTIYKCLYSLTSLRQRIECELIVVDTGCDEETLQIIKKFADQVIKFAWCNDFAKARNAALEVACGEWFLCLDDDEWFEETSDIEEFFVSGEYKNYTVGRYAQRNYFDRNGEAYEDCWVGRMAELGSDVRYVGKVHETPSYHPGAIRNFDCYVHHYGYVYTTKEAEYQHYLRNETLLKEMLQEDHNNMRLWTHLAQEYWAVSEDDKLEKLCSDGLELVKDWNRIGTEKVRETFYVGRILAAQESGQLQKAIQYLEEAIRDHRNSSICLAKLFSLAVTLYFQGENYCRCLENIRSYLYLYEAVDRKIEDIENGTIFTYGTFGEQVYEKVICLLLRIAIKYNDLDTIREYFDRIPWEKTILYEQQQMVIREIVSLMSFSVYSELYIHILKCFWERSDRDSEFNFYFFNALKSCEERYLKIDLQTWMDGVVSYCENAILEQIIIADRTIHAIQGVNDVRYDYWDFVTVEVRLRLGEQQCGYTELHALLQKYADTQIAFYRTYLKEELANESLPESYQLAAALQRIFQYEEAQDIYHVLHFMKEILEIYLPLKEVLITYIQLYIQHIDTLD